MTDTNTVSADLLSKVGLQTSTTSSTSSNPAQQLGQKDFFTLIVAQMQNQDPMQPQDNTQFISQMAQFGTLDSMQKLTTTVSDLSTSLQSSRALQASTLVGRTVLVSGDTSYSSQSGTMTGLVELPQNVANLQVGVYDQNGQLVRTINMGNQSAGNAQFTWDGLNNSGTGMPQDLYTIKSTADIDGKSTQLTTDLPANVESVSFGTTLNDSQLNLTGMGSVPISSIKQIY